MIICIWTLPSCRYESAAASFRVCLQSYLSSDLLTVDGSRESSPLHTSSPRTTKVTLLHKNQEPSARDASVVNYIVQQVQCWAYRNFWLFLAHHAHSMSCLSCERDICLSVCLSVTLIDCDHTVQQEVEMGRWQDMSVCWLPACQSRLRS